VARSRYRRRQNERGFALLLIFLMAAILAITLYMEIPRLAMQSQRDKEETLIDRGEQYKRAIQLFVAKAKRYPADIKELENFQNQRFLRHRYIDPMTGKDEWRLIHVNNGVLTDSKLTKPNAPGGKEDPKTPNGFVGEQVGLGGSPNTPQTGGAASARDRRRPNEGANTTMPGATPGQGPAGGDLSGGQNSGAPPLPGQGSDNGAPSPGAINPATGQPTAGQAGQPGYPSAVTVPGQAGPPGIPGLPGMPGIPGAAGNRNITTPGTTPNSGSSSSGNSFVGGGGSFVGGSSSFVGGSATGSQPAQTGSGQLTYPGQTFPGQPGMPVNSQTGGVSPYPVQAGSNGNPPGFPQPGAVAGAGNSAADMIRNILTTPRPGGMPQNNSGIQTIGGGIAGVASTAEGEGVKVYNDHSLYQEWEFIYDPSKVKQIPNPNATGAGGTPADRMNNNPNTTNPNMTNPSMTNPSNPNPMMSPGLPGR
jgi:type II secretory pathway pseudopilin PulG